MRHLRPDLRQRTIAGARRSRWRPHRRDEIIDTLATAILQISEAPPLACGARTLCLRMLFGVESIRCQIAVALQPPSTQAETAIFGMESGLQEFAS